MRLGSLNPWEIGAALTISGIGVFVWQTGLGYRMGSLRNMGAGYFPVVVGISLAGLGIVLTLMALRVREHFSGIEARPLLMVLLSILAFGALIERAGLVPACVALVVLSSLAQGPFRPVQTALLAAGLAAMGVAVFIWGLGLPVRALRW